mgnify:CR=1 FL=1
MNYKKLVDGYKNTNGIIWENIKNIDTDYIKNYEEFIQKFPYGIPDIKELDYLKIRGNIIFDGNISLIGKVEIINA